MLKSDAPLLVNPKPSWHKLSWFMEFMASMKDCERNTIQTARLDIAAGRHLFAWAEAEAIDFDLKKKVSYCHRNKKPSPFLTRVS
jgi:D-amino-acid dehydrogenase